MSRQTKGPKRPDFTSGRPVSLRQLADYLGLSPATLSLVINQSPASSAIPKDTQERIFAAVAEFHYRPNQVARSLRTQHSRTVGVVLPEICDGYTSLVLSGIDDYLLKKGYFYVIVTHRRRPDLLRDFGRLLLGRSVEGIIAVDTPCRSSFSVPVIAVSGKQKVSGGTNIVLDHDRAATIALQHLRSFGHRRIAFLRGQSFSSDADIRWNAIVAAARRMKIAMPATFTAQLEGESTSPESGYLATQHLVAAGARFSALFAFNDISAIGAMHALHDAGLSVPEDVSIVGFDDIQSAAFQNPSLTTIRQPLREMGELAAKLVLQSIASPRKHLPAELVIAPELVARESTARIRR